MVGLQDLPYLELVRILTQSAQSEEERDQILQEFERREKEVVSISLQDYHTLQEGLKVLKVIHHLVNEKWRTEKDGNDECYLLAIAEVINRIPSALSSTLRPSS